MCVRKMRVQSHLGAVWKLELFEMFCIVCDTQNNSSKNTVSVKALVMTRMTGWPELASVNASDFTRWLPFWFLVAPAESLPSRKCLTLGAMSHGTDISMGKPSNFPSHFLKSFLWSSELALSGHISGLN